MRRFLPPLMLALLLALPGRGIAQDAEPEETAEETAAPDEPGYEPDQRGGHEEEGLGTADGAAGGEPEYEPDQRGEHDGGDAGTDEEEMAAEPTSVGETVLAADYAEADRAGGRGYGVYTSFFVGAGLTGLDALWGDNLVTPAQQGSFGASLGIAIGLRIGPVSFGPRVSLTVDPSFVLGTVGVDVTADLTTDRLVPTLRLGLGYAFLAGVSDSLPSQRSVGGLYTELGAGFRYDVGGPFRFGAELSGGWLALSRGEVPDCEDPCTDMGSFDLRRRGEGHGLTLRLHVFGGFDF